MKKLATCSPRLRSSRFTRHKSGMRLSTGAFAALICACGLHSALGVNGVWNGTTNNAYTTGTNWSSTPTVPDGTATFNNAGNGQTTITLGGAAVSVGALRFDTNAAAYTLGSTVGDGTFTFTSAAPIAVANPVATNQTINSNLNLGTAAAVSFTNSTNLGGPVLTVAGNVTGGTSNTAQVLTLAGTGSGVLSGAITNGTASSLGVTVSGGSTWTLSGTGSNFGGVVTAVGGDPFNFTSGVTVNGGNLIVGSNGALGSNGVLVTGVGSTISAGGGARTISNGIATNNVSLTIGGSNALTINGNVGFTGTNVLTVNNTALTTLGGQLQLRNRQTSPGGLAIAGSGNLTITGSVVNNSGGTSNAGTAFTAVGSLTYNGSGTLTLAGANTYTGATAFNAGTVTLDYSTNAATKISGTGTGGTLTSGGSTINLNGGATAETVNGLTLNAGTTTINQTGGTSTLTVGGINRGAGSALAVNAGGVVNTTSGTANSLLTNAAGAVGVVGGNDWAAKNAANTSIVGLSTVTNTYSNSTATTVTNNASTDVVTDVNLSAAATTSTLRFNTANARTVTVGTTLGLTQGGILVTPAVGNNLTTITGGTLNASNSLVVFQNNTANGLTIASTIGTASGFIKSGAGLVTLSNPNNTYTGATFLNGGTTNIIADTSLGAAPATATAAQLGLNGGALQFGADGIVLAANRGITLYGNGGTIDTNGNSGRIDGIIAGGIAVAGNGTFGAFTKAGNGTLTLTATNTYQSATVVNGGTLSLAKAGTISGTIVTGGTLSLAMPLTVNRNGTLLLAANNTVTSTSTLTLAGGALSVGGGTLQGSAVAAGGTGTNVAGMGLLTLTANSSVNFLGTAGTVVLSSFDPTNFAAGSFLLTISGTNFGTTTSSVDGTNDRFVIGQLLSATQLANISFNVNGTLYSATEFSLSGGFYEIVPGAVIAVPEPSTWAAVGMMVGLYVYGRRRTRREA